MAEKRPEKRIAEMTLRISEDLKRDLQDLAASEDRSLSDIVRALLEQSMYGLKVSEEIHQRIGASRLRRGGTQ